MTVYFYQKIGQIIWIWPENQLFAAALLLYGTTHTIANENMGGAAVQENLSIDIKTSDLGLDSFVVSPKIDMFTISLRI